MFEEKEKIVCMECGESGGRFRLVGEKGYVHTPGCDRPIQVRDSAKDPYNFVSTHIAQSGEPIHVQNSRHMARLEKEHGVVSRVRNYDQSNW
jgi:hypothetical protein